MSTRKSTAESLRKGLKQEDDALEARFSTAESVVSQLRGAAGPGAAASAPAATEERKSKAPAERVVRETVSMPLSERNTLDDLLTTARRHGLYEVTRSQLLRAGIAQLAALEADELERELAKVERLRPGRK